MINNNQCNNDVICPMLEFTIKHDEFEKESSDRIRFSTYKKMSFIESSISLDSRQSVSMAAEMFHETAKNEKQLNSNSLLNYDMQFFLCWAVILCAICACAVYSCGVHMHVAGIRFNNIIRY